LDENARVSDWSENPFFLIIPECNAGKIKKRSGKRLKRKARPAGKRPNIFFAIKELRQLT